MNPDKCLPIPRWHAQLLSMLPTIRAHAAVAFRHLNSETRKEAIQEAIVNAAVVYARLVELKKAELAYPNALARYAVARIKRGHRGSRHTAALRSRKLIGTNWAGSHTRGIPLTVEAD